MYKCWSKSHKKRVSIASHNNIAWWRLMLYFTRRLPTHIALLSFTCFVATDITLVKHSFMVKINTKRYASIQMNGTKKSGWKESYICGCCQYYVRSLISQLILRNHWQVHNVNQLWACYFFLFIENTFGLAFIT